MSEATKMLINERQTKEVEDLLESKGEEEKSVEISSDSEESDSNISAKSLCEKSDVELSKQYIFVGSKKQKKIFRRMWKDENLKL